MGTRDRGTPSWLALVFPFFAFAACNQIIGANDPSLNLGDASSGASCVLNSDCTTAGEVCIFRVCSPPCRTDADCMDGSRCLQTQVGTACVADGIAACSAASACPAGSSCESGFCRNTCRSSADCLSQQQCVAGACVGTDPVHDPGLDAGGGGPDASPDTTIADDAPVDSTLPPDTGLDTGTPEDTGTGPGMDSSPTDSAPEATVEAGCGNTMTDVHNCGSCGHDCSTLPNVSAAGLGCSAGHCSYQCAKGYGDCASTGTGCPDSLGANPNCGACGTTCVAGSTDPVCGPVAAAASGYGCVSGCSGSQMLCGSSCVDTTMDDNNCNGCGNKCATNEHCVSSSCQCASPYHLCSTSCVAEDDTHCGASCLDCTSMAPTSGTGTCNTTTLMCTFGCNNSAYAICSNVCVDETMQGNCGACGKTCSGTTGICAPSGNSGSCVECTSGMQCKPGSTTVPQNCVGDTWVDQNACGGTTPVCNNGGCVQCTSGTQCAGGWVQTCSGNVWVNQTQCTSSEVCRVNMCVNALEDIGYSSTLSGTFTAFANELYLLRLPALQHNATLQTFGVVSTVAGNSARLVLYQDNGSGSPGTYIAQTSSSFTVVVGAKEQTTSTQAALTSGTVYWLGVVMSADTALSGQTDANQTGEKLSLSFSAAFPMPGPTGAAIAPASDLGIYISVVDTN
jgi:hypothetical protein